MVAEPDIQVGSDPRQLINLLIEKYADLANIIIRARRAIWAGNDPDAALASLALAQDECETLHKHMIRIAVRVMEIRDRDREPAAVPDIPDNGSFPAHPELKRLELPGYSVLDAVQAIMDGRAPVWAEFSAIQSSYGVPRVILQWADSKGSRDDGKEERPQDG